MDKELLKLLLGGGMFPTGGFSQSKGLETYVQDGTVKDVSSFTLFLDRYIQNVLARFEGPYLCAAYKAAGESLSALCELNQEVTAIYTAREARAASHRTGKAFLRLVSELFEDREIRAYYQDNRQRGINYLVAFALVSARVGLTEDEALKLFFYSETSNLVQAGLKLIPLGNVQAQTVLLGAFATIAAAVETAEATPLEEASFFNPGLDIASIRHESLFSRLYMS